MSADEYRVERDSMGELRVPAQALWGAQTQRAVQNFPLSGLRMPRGFIRALGLVKWAAAGANVELGELDKVRGFAIQKAALEVAEGRHDAHFPVDVFQTGSGTSSNMNANEVIAHLATQYAGGTQAHPNDHVNRCQSSNDVIPTAIHLAAALAVSEQLLPALKELSETIARKAGDVGEVVKTGRTHLMDAMPLTLGQEIGAWRAQVEDGVARLQACRPRLHALALGGTAIGTGINADPRYPALVVEELRTVTGLDVVLSENLVEATPDTGAFVMFSGVLKRVAVKLSKMCNDLRLLSSGPRCGLAEINLPPMQPGSSIMPGKVNPVIPEVVNQVAFQVIGNDLTITLASEAGQLQLNVMEPILAFNLFQSVDMLTAAIDTLRLRCIAGITANREHAREMVERSIGIVTAVVPALGYERSSEVAKEALATGRPVRELILEKGYLTAAQLDDLLSIDAMTKPRPLALGDRTV